RRRLSISKVDPGWKGAEHQHYGQKTSTAVESAGSSERPDRDGHQTDLKADPQVHGRNYWQLGERGNQREKIRWIHQAVRSCCWKWRRYPSYRFGERLRVIEVGSAGSGVESVDGA